WPSQPASLSDRAIPDMSAGRYPRPPPRCDRSAQIATKGCRGCDRSENPLVRLNAYLARAGVASRRKSDELIKAGRVRVNGRPGALNTFVGLGDDVRVDDRQVSPQQLAYVLLHKPAGVVTTARDPHGRLTVVQLVEHEIRIVPVGRLDADTTGVLLLTND